MLQTLTQRFIKVCIILSEKHCDFISVCQTISSVSRLHLHNQILKSIYRPAKCDVSYPANFDSARSWRIFDATRRNNVKQTDPNELRFVAPQFITAFNDSDGLLPWLSRTSVGKRNLLTITSSGSDTELHESPLMLADSFSIFHPSPSSSSRASRERNGTGVRSASRHDEEKRVRETPKWCDLNRTRRGARRPPSPSRPARTGTPDWQRVHYRSPVPEIHHLKMPTGC